MPKRLLIVTQHFWPENFRINDMVDGFLADGIVVDILCGLPNYPHGEWFDGYTAHGPFAEDYHGANVYRCREIARKGNTSLRIFLNYISFPITAACSLHRLAGNYDAVLCYNTSPVLMSFPAILAARKFHAPLTNYVLDIWPENLYSVLNIQNAVLRKTASAVSDWHYRRADRLIAMNDGLKERLQARVGTVNAKSCRERIKQYAVIPQYCEDFYDSRAGQGGATQGGATCAGDHTGSPLQDGADLAGGNTPPLRSGDAPQDGADLASMNTPPLRSGGAPQGGAPQGDAPQGGAPQGGAPQGGAPQGGAPQGGAPQGGAPQVGAHSAGDHRSPLQDGDTTQNAAHDSVFNIQFAGNFSPAQSLDTVIAAMAIADAQLRAMQTGTMPPDTAQTETEQTDTAQTDNHGTPTVGATLCGRPQSQSQLPAIHLTLIGDGMSRAALQADVQQRGLTHCVHFHNSVSATEIPALAAQADALIIPLASTADLGLTIPAKFASCMAAGKPLLISLDGEGARVARESGGALVSPASNAAALAQNMQTLAAMPAAQRAQMGTAAHQYYKAHFDRSTLLKQIEDFIF